MDTSKNVAFNVSEDIPDQQNSESESESEETPLNGIFFLVVI